MQSLSGNEKVKLREWLLSGGWRVLGKLFPVSPMLELLSSCSPWDAFVCSVSGTSQLQMTHAAQCCSRLTAPCKTSYLCKSLTTFNTCTWSCKHVELRAVLLSPASSLSSSSTAHPAVASSLVKALASCGSLLPLQLAASRAGTARLACWLLCSCFKA